MTFDTYPEQRRIAEWYTETMLTIKWAIRTIMRPVPPDTAFHLVCKLKRGDHEGGISFEVIDVNRQSIPEGVQF